MTAVGSADKNVSWPSATVHHDCMIGTEKWLIEGQLLAAEKNRTSPIRLCSGKTLPSGRRVYIEWENGLLKSNECVAFLYINIY